MGTYTMTQQKAGAGEDKQRKPVYFKSKMIQMIKEKQEWETIKPLRDTERKSRP